MGSGPSDIRDPTAASQGIADGLAFPDAPETNVRSSGAISEMARPLSQRSSQNKAEVLPPTTILVDAAHCGEHLTLIVGELQVEASPRAEEFSAHPDP